MRKVTVATVQMACTKEREENIATAERLTRDVAKQGANIILLPELFETEYFCQQRRYDFYELATTLDENPAVCHFRDVAKELGIVMPVSFYEKVGQTFYNSVAVIDADGKILGIYRKTHIPDDHYYQEKFYFSLGNTGFKTWQTQFGRIGVGICWDQWFPEAARCMVLDGAEILLYPTAIGAEPILDVDSAPHWQRCMQGHAAANVVPVVAANRVGTEKVTPDAENAGQSSQLTFYGTSFLTDETGAIVAQSARDGEDVARVTYDLDEIAKMRRDWGLFRDRRPEMYGAITA